MTLLLPALLLGARAAWAAGEGVTITPGQGVTELCGPNTGVPCPPRIDPAIKPPRSAAECTSKDPAQCATWKPGPEKPPGSRAGTAPQTRTGGDRTAEATESRSSPQASGGPGPEAGSTEGAGTPGGTQPLSRSGAAAIRNARRLADGLGKPADPGDALGGPQARGAAEAGPAPGSRAADAGGRRDAANPESAGDLVLASMAGYSGAFEVARLKVGRLPDGSMGILRLSGAPATGDELRRLKELIRAEPQALQQRPDFFDVISREEFGSLRLEYQERPERREGEFKHIGLSSSKRDFLHTESCERLSGQCNRYSRQAHYKRGAYVPPEDLQAIWGKIQDDGPAEGGAARRAAARAAAAPVRERLVTASLFKRIAGLLEGGAVPFGEGPAEGLADEPASHPPGGGQPEGAATGPAGGGPAADAGSLSRQDPRGPADPRRPAGVYRAGARAQASDRRLRLGLLAAGALIGLLGLRRWLRPPAATEPG